MDLVDEVKARLNIEDVIGEYVELKRAGRNWRGLSPFKHEKTPSFIVSPEKQIWHDFSSGKGGNLISFVMDAEGIEFREALELLARKAGLDPAQFRGGQRKDNKEHLYKLLVDAGHFYQVQLTRNKTVLEYVLNKRGFSKDTTLKWQLGYAPSLPSSLYSYLSKKGYQNADIKKAGLISTSYRGETLDMFRGRLMIPLCDSFGRIIGFTGRILSDDPKAPKYINTPQTPLYDKSRHIFGLHLAKEAIRKEDYSLMVEGNLDVIASHQAGVSTAVATAGTALTQWQLKDLGRFSTDVRICFDTDSAGQAAAERAIALAAKGGASLSVIPLSGFKDPDELIRSDPKRWQQIVQKPVYGMDWLIDYYSKSLDVSSALGKKKLTDALLPRILSLADPVEQDHYLNQLARQLNVSLESLKQKSSRATTAGRVVKKSVKAKLEEASLTSLERQKLQDNLLSLLTLKPALRDLADLISISMVAGESPKKLLETLKAKPNISVAELESRADIGEYVKIEVVLFEELYEGLEINELRYEASRLQTRLIEQFVKTEKIKLAESLAVAKPNQTQPLLQRAHRLDQLLSQVNRG